MELLQFSQYIQTIDSHTMGEPTRIVTGGVPRIIGNTMMEKKKYMEKNLDWLRNVLMNEPRGHRDMFGAVFTDPCSDSCDLGVIFMESNGYLNMCGHGTIAAITTAVNIGVVEAKEIINIDTPAGIVKCKVKIEQDKVKEVTFVNVPSFVYIENEKIFVEGVGEVNIDIVFGGSFFGIVDAQQFGLSLISKEQQEIINLGLLIKKAANAQIRVEHPTNKEINKIDLIEFSLKSEKNEVDYRNTVVFGNGQIDRSPCGTGTCAKMALLYQQQKLKIAQPFIHESIIGSKFKGAVLHECKVGPYKAIVPEITGLAWITGMHQFVIDKEDPYNVGFTLS